MLVYAIIKHIESWLCFRRLKKNNWNSDYWSKIGKTVAWLSKKYSIYNKFILSGRFILITQCCWNLLFWRKNLLFVSLVCFWHGLFILHHGECLYLNILRYVKNLLWVGYYPNLIETYTASSSSIILFMIFERTLKLFFFLLFGHIIL